MYSHHHLLVRYMLPAPQMMASSHFSVAQAHNASSLNHVVWYNWNTEENWPTLFTKAMRLAAGSAQPSWCLSWIIKLFTWLFPSSSVLSLVQSRVYFYTNIRGTHYCSPPNHPPSLCKNRKILCLPTQHSFRNPAQINSLFQGLKINWVSLSSIAFVDTELCRNLFLLHVSKPFFSCDCMNAHVGWNN